MAAEQILLLRVAMDLGYGGLGPIFPAGGFEYVPIPETPKRASPRSLRFSQIPARSGGTIDQFVPSRYRGGLVHYDPEFETFTYGDPTKYKRGQLRRLRREDLLVFYAGLRPPEQRTGSKLYIIGYFTVEKVHQVGPEPIWPPPALQHLWANAHFRRDRCDAGLVVVEGAPSASRLLRTAIPLSDERQEVLPELHERLGLIGSVKRAGAGRWIPAAQVAGVERWLRDFEPATGDTGARQCALAEGTPSSVGRMPDFVVQEAANMLFNNCRSRPHAKFYGTGAFYDLYMFGAQVNMATDLRPSQHCCVATPLENGEIAFSWYSFTHEKIMEMPDKPGTSVRVLFGKELGSETLTRSRAIATDRYGDFFNVNGHFKRGAVIRPKGSCVAPAQISRG